MSVAEVKPVVSLISDEILCRLQTLTGASFGAYEFPKVVRPTKLATYVPQHGSVILTRGDVERVSALDCPGNPPATAWQQTFLIRVHIAPSESDNNAVEVYEDLAEAKIHRALTDATNWHTFGGYSINAEIGSVQTATSDGGYDGIAIPLIVTYRTSEGDLYTVRA